MNINSFFHVKFVCFEDQMKEILNTSNLIIAILIVSNIAIGQNTFERFAHISLKNNLMVFESNRESKFPELYLANIDGTGLTRLTNNTGMKGYPRWSPDGKSIVYYSLEDRSSNDFNIYLLNIETTIHKKITTYPGLDMAPVWSKDGHKIFYISKRSQNDELRVYDLQKETDQLVIKNIEHHYGISFSPDGDKFAAVRVYNKNSDIVIIDLKTKSVIKRFKNPAKENNPIWSPDGGSIFFASNRNKMWQIYSFDFNDNKIRNLSSGFGNSRFFTLSPLGETILFTLIKSGENDELYRMNQDGSGKRKINFSKKTAKQEKPGIISPEWRFKEARQFDFWRGEWDVNLRIRQPDYSWKDKIKATAKIYRVLNGKAILELWNSEPIKGFSIRYYDINKKKWVLWLNWPGKNRSGISKLEGEFRHGRGVFSNYFVNSKKDTVIYNYTFSDIGSKRLRWDDGYSTDGGKTWSANWIMEFNRSRDIAEPLILNEAHTYENDSLCLFKPFRNLNSFEGYWKGTITNIEGNKENNYPATLHGYKITNGCALMLFLEYANGKEFHLQSFNTKLKKWEQSVLNDRLGGNLEVFHGENEKRTIETAYKDSLVWKKYSWKFDIQKKKLSYELFKASPNNPSWLTIQKGVFQLVAMVKNKSDQMKE